MVWLAGADGKMVLQCIALAAATHAQTPYIHAYIMLRLDVIMLPVNK